MVHISFFLLKLRAIDVANVHVLRVEYKTSISYLVNINNTIHKLRHDCSAKLLKSSSSSSRGGGEVEVEKYPTVDTEISDIR